MTFRTDDTRSTYDAVARRYAQEIAGELNDKPFDREFLDRFARSVAGSGRVVELGCGPGHVAAYLAERGVEASGLDLSESMVAEARQMFPSLEFVAGDMLDLPFEDASLAGAVAFYSIIHFDDVQLARAFAEMRRVLGAEAQLALAFHVGDQVIHRDDWWGHAVSLDARFLQPGHVTSLLAGSMGAMTALTFATRYPDRLRTAMICGIDIVREPRTSVARRLMDPERIKSEEPEWAEQLERRHGPVQGLGAWEHLLRAIAEDVGTAPLLTPEELRRIRLPVQLVYGDRDVFVPVDHAVAIHRQLPDSRLLIAPNSPHQVMVSQPALFNLAAGGFYRATERIARERAASGAVAGHDGAGTVAAGDGASVFEPAAASVVNDDEDSDPFSNW